MSTDLAFHRLTVSRVEPQTDDSVAITFAVPDDLRPEFAHRPGQHVVVKADIAGEDVRRSYSICSPAGGDLRIGVKRIPEGRFSSWATETLRPGDTVEVMAPIGDFTLVPDAERPTRRVAVAAGSGITPVLSIIASALEAESEAEFTLVYGNRSSRTIMFLEEIEALKDKYPQRFSVIHVLSREAHQVPLFQGRIDAEKMRALATMLLPPDEIDEWYLCGPLELVETVTDTLTRLGVPADRVHAELFYDQRIESLPDHGRDDAGLVELVFTLEGRTSMVRVDPAGPSLLDYARSVRHEVPFACKGGMCATCKARVLCGEVSMTKNYALSGPEVDAGYVLTCQSHPVSVDRVELSFDAR